MKKIKKKKKCQCDGWALHVSLEKLPHWIMDIKETDIDKVYYCKKCDNYLCINKPRSKILK